jgi:hypothetical protein
MSSVTEERSSQEPSVDKNLAYPIETLLIGPPNWRSSAERGYTQPEAYYVAGAHMLGRCHLNRARRWQPRHACRLEGFFQGSYRVSRNNNIDLEKMADVDL